MSLTLQISMILAELVYFAVIFVLLKKKTLSLKYTLIWLAGGLVMLVLTVFPMLMVKLVRLFGVQDQMNGLFSMLFFFVLMIIMSLTSIVSRQSDRIRALTQETALLEKRIRELEKRPDHKTGEEQCDKKG